MRHIYYNYDDMPLVDYDKNGRPIRGTPEYWEKEGFKVYRNKPDAHCFTVEVKEDARDSGTVDQ